MPNAQRSLLAACAAAVGRQSVRAGIKRSAGSAVNLTLAVKKTKHRSHHR